MYYFSQRSKNNLNECHIDLQTLFNEVIKFIDFAVIEGHRGKEEQNKAYREDKSKVKFPNSKHNKKPSFAVDAVLYPIIWENINDHYYFSGYVKGVADQLFREGKMKHKLRAGADWNKNYRVEDENFKDLFHFELI